MLRSDTCRMLLRGLFVLAALGLFQAIAAADEIAHFTARGTFDDVKEALVAAIEGKGLVIDRVAHVGDMLERTGKDVGATRRLYRKAEILEFCSARISRDMMSADPRQIAYCPYTIAVYTLANGGASPTPGEADRVHIAYRRPPKAEGMAGVERLLDDIVREALK
ncbi:MAG: DUF302 domain-containing protein [Burkholderiales bacterium]|nr:DUF302 domain-containing protein [Burkholderiales bacterium]